MTRRVYLAAKYSRRLELIGYARQLEAIGYAVKARWLSENHDLPVGGDPSLGLRFALDDMEDCGSADVVVSFTEEPGLPGAGRNRGGRHVEFGLALQRRLSTGSPSLLVVGWRENVFHYAPEVQFFSGWSEALHSLESRSDGGAR